MLVAEAVSYGKTEKAPTTNYVRMYKQSIMYLLEIIVETTFNAFIAASCLSYKQLIEQNTFLLARSFNL